MSIHQNRMIEAGAGTGKTTRLVRAVIEALMVRKLSLESIVALTFTNKAAGELKDRVAQSLNDVLSAPSIDPLRRKPWWPSEDPGLSLGDLQALANEAISVLDRANISTIHSFAFSLLKRFPLATGIAPTAEIDDKGLRFDELFGREWPKWLSTELGDASPRETPWLDVLAHVTLPRIEETARKLSDFVIPLSKLPISDAHVKIALRPFYEESRDLAALHQKNEVSDRIAHACEEVLGISTADTPATESLSQETRDQIARNLPTKMSKSWTEPEFRRLKMLRAIARNSLAGGDRRVAQITELLTPFIASFRQTLLSEGCLTHSALLYLSRDMVRDHEEIRAVLKRNFRMMLIDEFQDTDPLQGELLVYLAEALTGHSPSIDAVRLEAGKLFVVGDPKQSIYRFRGADIAAYEQIGNMIVKQGGLRETLETNYRSQAQIIHLVNAAFRRIIEEVPEISPAYRAVLPHHPHDPGRPLQDVQLWLADANDPQSVADAQITEAEHVARWIKDAKDRLEVHDPREGRRPLIYRDIALIFRSYSPMDPFIDALRRHGIPFAVESERYFFTTPEVTDMLNILHAADDPSDDLSLVGFLRGPLAGIPDEEILRRKETNSLDDLEPVKWLRNLSLRLRREPLADVLDSVFEDTYLIELAARSYHGDQTIANLLKLRRLLEEFSAEGVTTMGVLLARLEEFFADDKIEGESPLADENYNAVRLLTVHKSKGLEFPVVFLPSLHSEVRPHPPEPFLFDWRTQKVGLSIQDASGAKLSNLAKLELDEQTQRREAAEENRILYVAMTRARECLILSGGTSLKGARSRTYLHRLIGAWDQSLDALVEGVLPVGEHSLTIRRLAQVTHRNEATILESDNPLKRLDVSAFAKRWAARAKSKAAVLATPRVTTPSAQKNYDSQLPTADEESPIPAVSESRLAPKVFGTLMHKILEDWDFSVSGIAVRETVAAAVEVYFATSNLPLALRTASAQSGAAEEATAVMKEFMASSEYAELQNSQILGREIPFVYSAGAQTLMRGVMDIVYRTPEGKLVIGDYKTDRASVADRSTYDAQARAYSEAVHRATGETPVFKLLFLRPG